MKESITDDVSMLVSMAGISEEEAKQTLMESGMNVNVALRVLRARGVNIDLSEGATNNLNDTISPSAAATHPDALSTPSPAANENAAGRRETIKPSDPPTVPGSFRVGGSDTSTNDESFTVTGQQSIASENAEPLHPPMMEPLTARIVHGRDDDLEGLQRQLRQQAQEIEQIRRQVANAAVAEVISPDNDEEEATPIDSLNGDEAPMGPNSSRNQEGGRGGSTPIISGKRKKQALLVAAFVVIVIGVVVGVSVYLTSRDETPTSIPAPQGDTGAGPSPSQTSSPTLRPSTVLPTSPNPTSEPTQQTPETGPSPSQTSSPTLRPTTVLPTTPNPTSEPTQQTPSPTTQSPADQNLAALLSDVSPDGGAALRSPSTPQNNALKWLAGNANLDSYSDERKIQRYALATLYYSTNGDSWKNKNGWLGDGDECGWWNHAENQFCVDGAVVELDLFQNNLVGTIPAELALLSTSLGKCLQSRIACLPFPS